MEDELCITVTLGVSGFLPRTRVVYISALRRL